MDKLLRQNIANFISFFRVLAAPLFVVLLPSTNSGCLILLFLAAISDFLDGYIARKLDISSKFGELIDPIADKVFCNTVLWSLYTNKGLHWPEFFVALMLSIRDIFLLFGGLFLLKTARNKHITPIFLSKICTTFVFVLGIMLIIAPDSEYTALASYASIILIILTTYMYSKRFTSSMKNV